MSKIEDIDIINYMINKEATIKETAEYFDVSVSTIKKRLSSVKKELLDSSKIKKDLNSLSDNNQNKGRVKGGQVLGSGVKLTEDMATIVEHAIEILVNNLTIEEASEVFKIPTSTLSEHLKLLSGSEYHDIYNDLQTLFEYHKKNKVICENPALFNLQQKYSNYLQNMPKTR